MPKIFKILDKFKIVYDVTDKILMTICKLLLIADILIATLTVIQRYVPNAIFPPMPWGEQMVLTFMVYMAVLSASLAIRRGSHIRMTAFDKYLPKTLVKISDLISDLIVLLLGVIMVVYGAQVCTGPLARFAKYESIPTLSKLWMYLPVPIAGAGMIVFELEAIYQNLRSFFVKEEKAAVSEEVQAL